MFNRSRKTFVIVGMVFDRWEDQYDEQGPFIKTWLQQGAVSLPVKAEIVSVAQSLPWLWRITARAEHPDGTQTLQTVELKSAVLYEEASQLVSANCEELRKELESEGIPVTRYGVQMRIIGMPAGAKSRRK